MPRGKRNAPPRFQSTSYQHQGSSATRFVSQPEYENLQDLEAELETELGADLEADLEAEVDEGSSSTKKRKTRHLWTVNVIDDDGVVHLQHLKVKELFAMNDGRRVLTEWNRENQPIGESGGLLSGFLGKIAKNFDHLPITYNRWPDVPQQYKKNLYEQTIQRKFVVDNGVQKKFILMSVGRKWSDARSYLFNRSYNWELTYDQNCQMVPKGITPDHWAIFTAHRVSEKFQEMSRRNATNREKQVIPHTLGRMSYARKKDEVEKDTHQSLSRLDMFPIAHKKSDGSFVNDKAQQKYEHLEKEVQETGSENEAYVRVFGKEHPGYVRGMGMGVTKTQIFGSDCSHGEPSSNEKIANLELRVNRLRTQLADYDDLKADYDEIKAQLAFLMQRVNRNPAIHLDGGGESSSPTQN